MLPRRCRRSSKAIARAKLTSAPPFAQKRDSDPIHPGVPEKLLHGLEVAGRIENPLTSWQRRPHVRVRQARIPLARNLSLFARFLNQPSSGYAAQAGCRRNVG